MWLDAAQYITRVEDERTPAPVLSPEDAEFLDRAYALMAGARLCECGALITELRGGPVRCAECQRERRNAMRRLRYYAGRAA